MMRRPEPEWLGARVGRAVAHHRRPAAGGGEARRSSGARRDGGRRRRDPKIGGGTMRTNVSVTNDDSTI
uniref:Uncharacterized protein n=1 Tax=Oryza nivara TaxID=4536 RepID=A0A0E0HRA4_ORYNI